VKLLVTALLLLPFAAVGAMEARSPIAMSFGVPENRAGGIGMNLRIYVLPETVSFSGIAMEEIPSTQGSHTGYFENPYFAKIWYHTEEMWAGRWGNIDYENYWDVDRAWGGDEMPHEKQDGTVTFNLNEGAWRNGDIVWNISWGWAEKDRKPGDSPAKPLATPYNQEFHIDASGTLSVSKFQHTAVRGTNDVFRLNGDVVQPTPAY
jgi:hypothetical protein